jgi:hypothetical protein
MLKRIRHHLFNWAEGYLWIPLALASIIGASMLVQALTGHSPKENIDWLLDYASVSVKAVLIIVFTSVFKQATGSWMTKEEKFAHPGLTLLSDVKILVTFLAFVYLFSH